MFALSLSRVVAFIQSILSFITLITNKPGGAKIVSVTHRFVTVFVHCAYTLKIICDLSSIKLR